MKAYTATTAELINQAIADANAAVTVATLAGEIRPSNGSEAWQSVRIRADGRSKIAKELKQIEDVEHDSYYGYLISPHGHCENNYYAEEVWTQRLEASLREKGFDARRAERLL
jgi:hypothetical protein